MALLMIRFIIGILILIIATHFLIHLAKKISKALKISPLIVGVTVVAFGTSLPELSVSIIAVINDDVGLALGNIIGSNIINVFLVLAFSILISDFRIGNTKTQKNILILLIVTALFIFLNLINLPNIFLGLLLLSLTVIITAIEYRWGVIGREHEDIIFFRYFHTEHLSVKEIFLLPFLVIGIILGGIFVVNSAEQISIISGYSTTIIGLSLTAISTSLPELLATFISREERQDKIAIGNIIGSNIYNLLFVGGIIILFSTKLPLLISEIFWLLFSTSYFVIIIWYYKNRSISKKIGIFLIVLLFLYLYSLSLK